MIQRLRFLRHLKKKPGHRYCAIVSWSEQRLRDVIDLTRARPEAQTGGKTNCTPSACWNQ